MSGSNRGVTSSVGVLFVAESAQHFSRVPGPWPGTINKTLTPVAVFPHAAWVGCG